mgnify:CR=1 FL=1
MSNWNEMVDQLLNATQDGRLVDWSERILQRYQSQGGRVSSINVNQSPSLIAHEVVRCIVNGALTMEQFDLMVSD